MHCPLCEHPVSTPFFNSKTRSFHECERCHLVFVPPETYLTEQEEKDRYDLHINNPEDQGYINFLSRLLNPVKEHVKAPAMGLDYGSGPEPALLRMLEKGGYDMHAYDLYYARDENSLNKRYDFVTCCEVAEHLKNPSETMKLLVGLLRPGGSLFIMTQAPKGPDHFKGWSYKNDMTHICFYRPESFEWVADRYGCTLSRFDSCVYQLITPAN